ncbi:MAG: mechanosensitive ion channel [Rickettsiales bacterium]|nr:mechanosensitive ion channel [Rickettsiales bacterium]
MRQENSTYMQLLETIETTISDPSFYWQSLSIIACFIISYLFYSITRRVILPKITVAALKKNLGINKFIHKYINPLLYPLFAAVFLAIGVSIFAQFFKETLIFSTTLQLVTLFLFLRFLRISSGNNFISNSAGLFLIPALILNTFGLLDPTIRYLDEYALKVGSLRISIYLIIKAFLVVLILFFISSLIIRKSKSYIESNTKIKSSTKGIIGKFIDIIVYSVVAIVMLKTLGVDMTTLAVLGGAIGVGIGFGLQKIASNFISGIILLFEKSVEVGDWVEIDNGNIFGIVKHFGGRYTLIECFDGKEVMVPNEDFIISKVVNLTYSNNRARIEINVNISYDSDLELAKKILEDCATEHQRCINYPEIECYITDFADSSIKFILYFWVNDVTQGRMSAKSEVMSEIWKRFKENNIKIPLPQREINVVQK